MGEPKIRIYRFAIRFDSFLADVHHRSRFFFHFKGAKFLRILNFYSEASGSSQINDFEHDNNENLTLSNYISMKSHVHNSVSESTFATAAATIICELLLRALKLIK